jgi:hypothetical protein
MVGEEQLVEDHGRVRMPTIILYISLAFVGWMSAAWVGYASASSAMNARVSVLEAQRDDILRRLNSIDTKIDELLARPR